MKIAPLFNRSRNFWLCVTLTAGSFAWAAEPVHVTNENVSTFYQSFKRLTKEERYVGKEFMEFCDDTPSRKTYGPHAHASVHIYVNAEAGDAISTKPVQLPVGAVIVKEKLGEKAVVGIGGMIKRAKGYDPANGDWEFFYYAPGEKFTSGKLTTCIDCHNNAKRDHTFSVWKLAEAKAR